MNRSLKRTGSRVLVASVLTGAVILALGLLRYGGPEGLWRRANAEIAGYLPHPVYVPTPLAAEPVESFKFTAPPATPEVASTSGPAVLAQGDSVPTVEPTGSAALETAPFPSVTVRPLFSAANAAQDVTDRRAYGPVAPADDTDTLRSRTATLVPSPTAPPTATALPPPTPTRVPQPPPTQLLTGLAHYWQTWNNCGPATLAMNLSYFGVSQGQDKVAATLRPYRDDKNVNPWEMAEYARSQGLRAVARVNGDADRLRALVNAGVPVLIETWYEPKPNDGMGHYRLIVGYDDPPKQWIAYDSYDSHGVAKNQPYAGIRLPYEKLDTLWAVFNRTYVVVYDEARSAAVESIIGGDMDDTAMWKRSLASAENAIRAQEQDAFAWFNTGSSLVALGDYPRAAQAFDQARQIKLPWRMLWYQFAPFRAYFEVGRHDEIIALADATLAQAKSVEELYYWRGRALQAKGDIEGARAAWEAALALNGNYSEASAALAALP